MYAAREDENVDVVEILLRFGADEEANNVSRYRIQLCSWAPSFSGLIEKFTLTFSRTFFLYVWICSGGQNSFGVREIKTHLWNSGPSRAMIMILDCHTINFAMIPHAIANSQPISFYPYYSYSYAN